MSVASSVLSDPVGSLSVGLRQVTPRRIAGAASQAVAPLSAPVRHWLATSLRDRVAGDQAEEMARAIWLAPGERWFCEQDPIWRVHEDASMFMGGIRALLLQSLHPLAMAGVAGHSGYRGDPWGRLQRTSAYLAQTTFGTVADAEASIAMVRRIHTRVRGKTPDGRAYAASDPHLLRWVHIAEADSFLAAYRRYGAQTLTAQEQDRYVQQLGVSARKLGVLDPPRTVAELDAAIEAYRPELESTPAARDVTRFLLLQPPLPWFERAGFACLAAGAVALLPMWAKEMLWLPVLPVTERTVSRAAGTVAVQTVRWAIDDPRAARQAALDARPGRA